MFWYILLGVCIIAGIVSFFIFINVDCDFMQYIMALSFLILIILVPLCITMSIDYKKQISTFEETKRYIEEVVPTLPETDNYAITTSKIEMNKWLYEIQYRYKNYHFWNFVPKEVMELEEIK